MHTSNTVAKNENISFFTVEGQALVAFLSNTKRNSSYTVLNRFSKLVDNRLKSSVRNGTVVVDRLNNPVYLRLYNTNVQVHTGLKTTKKAIIFKKL